MGPYERGNSRSFGIELPLKGSKTLPYDGYCGIVCEGHFSILEKLT